MEWNEVEGIFLELAGPSVSADDRLKKLRDQLWLAAVRYADLRVRWLLAVDTEERREIDQQRTVAHNAFIDSCNALSRAMARAELSTDWRKRIGDESTSDGRKSVGDFASFIHCKLGLQAR